jgi:hypothetical protein
MTNKLIFRKEDFQNFMGFCTIPMQTLILFFRGNSEVVGRQNMAKMYVKSLRL